MKTCLKLLVAASPVAWGVRLAKVLPQDEAIALKARSETVAKDNPCRNMHTPKVCEEEQQAGAGNRSAHAVLSAWLEDLHWLNEMPWSDHLTVMLHDRASTRSHNSKMQLMDNLNLAEESEVHVKAVNPRRSHSIKFQDIPNSGDEGAAYLQWIIDNYDNLPDVSFFIQGHRCADHAKFDMSVALPSFRQCFRPEEGYRDLNTYNVDHKPVKCKSVQDIMEHPPTGMKVDNFEDIWIEYFYREFGPLPEKLCWDQFAQFAVSKAAILSHPKKFYETLHEGATSGKTSVEFFWRMIFRPEAVSWDELPKKDRNGRVIRKQYQFTPEEVLENNRYVDPKGQHLNKYERDRY
mmetsp:Transcript_125788/g.367635  ORF Transcript_125788/g.367635 Transcript_125788/m.367635 type:complete len:349 (-) Transcript_125788:67-1113(-)